MPDTDMPTGLAESKVSRDSDQASIISPPRSTRSSDYRTVLGLAWPLIVSNSFSTIQIAIDRIYLSNLSPNAVSAATSAVMIFWSPFILFFSTGHYVSTFVAQYTGAGRDQRVGASVWQGLYFAVLAGMLMLCMLPWTDSIVSISDHPDHIRTMEADYFWCLCWMAIPALILAVTSSFFSGRGETRTVIWLNALGTIVNVVLDPVFIFGHFGLPAMGVAGAGWATVIASWASALLGLTLFFRKTFRERYHTLKAWQFESSLFLRLLRYGLPSGTQWMIDTTAFSAFLLITGWFGEAELAATSIVYTINIVTYIPMVGMAIAVSILVGQRLGNDQPDLAEHAVWASFHLTAVYMLVLGSLLVIFPSLFLAPFRNDSSAEQWHAVERIASTLLWFVFLYSLFDGMTLIFSHGLRGAGDTLFVTLVSLSLAWPLMVLPTWLAWKMNWGLLAGWGFMTMFILVQGLCYLLRFRRGRWKSMRVIEPSVIDPEERATPPVEKPPSEIESQSPK